MRGCWVRATVRACVVLVAASRRRACIKPSCARDKLNPTMLLLLLWGMLPPAAASPAVFFEEGAPNLQLWRAALEARRFIYELSGELIRAWSFVAYCATARI